MKPFYYLSDFPERKNAGQNFPNAGKNIFQFLKRPEPFIASTPDVTSTES